MADIPHGHDTGEGQRSGGFRQARNCHAGGARDTVLFYAERDPAVLFGAWGAVVLVMLPFGLAVPDRFLAGACVSLLSVWLCWRTFRFELTSGRLDYRPNLFAAPVSIPLHDIRMVMATDLLGRPAESPGAAPQRGHLLLRTEARVVVIKSILRPHEAADAIRILHGRQQSWP